MFLLRRLIGKSFKGDAAGRDENIGVSNPKKFSEEDASRKALDQAGGYVREGKYERALLLLEKLGHLNPGVKGVGELVAVAEVCYAAASRPCMCASRKSRSPDWYKILKVDENSDIEGIRKRYRQLALLLHPDKNKHGKAEGAFKLVSEAYACLSDEKKRADFNTERSLQQGRCSLQTDVATRGPGRSPGYDCSRERKTKFRRPARSVPDFTEADWVLDQEKLKLFREKARARVLGNLADAWKERLYKSMGEFPLARVKSIGRKHQKNIPAKDVKCTEQQQRLNTEEQRVDKLKHALTKPVLSAKSVNNVIDESHDTHLNSVSPKVADKASSRMVSEYELSRPCKSLDELISELRAELNVSSKSTSNHKSQQAKSMHQEPVAVCSIKTDSKVRNEAGSSSEITCKLRNSVETCGSERNGSSKNMQGATRSLSAAVQRQMGTFMEANVIQQEAVYLADHNCSTSTTSGNSNLCDFSEKHSFNLNNNLTNHFCSSNVSAKTTSSSTNSLDHRESESPNTSEKIYYDPCSGGVEEKLHYCNRHATFSPNGSKPAEKNGTSGATPSVANTFLEDLLKQRTEGTDCFEAERNVDQISPFMHTVCTNNLSNRRVCRGDSLDREETVLHMQKEKSDQLLKTLQRLREEAKTVAASLNHIRNDRDNGRARRSFKTFFAAPSYQAFVWDTDG